VLCESENKPVGDSIMLACQQFEDGWLLGSILKIGWISCGRAKVITRFTIPCETTWKRLWRSRSG